MNYPNVNISILVEAEKNDQGARKRITEPFSWRSTCPGWNNGMANAIQQFKQKNGVEKCTVFHATSHCEVQPFFNPDLTHLLGQY